MTLNELISEVSTIVNRPDLEQTAIKTHVKAATYQAHGLDNFWRDKIEVLLTFASSEFIQELDHTVLTRFRAWDYIRIYDPVTGEPGAFFDIIKDAEALFDIYGAIKDHTCRSVGTASTLRSTKTEFSQVIGSYYSNPIVTPDNSYSSWIAETNPYCIIYRAASLMYAGINQQDQARKWEKMELEMRQQLLMNNLDPKGR